MGEGNPRSKMLAVFGSDHAVSLAVFILGVVSRLPFRSGMLFHWDSVNFALAAERFDMLLHQPHPPGFILYVLSGRWATGLAGDVNAGYVWISVLCSGLGAAAVSCVGRELFGRSTGVMAALLFICSPTVWFHGEVALTYALEAAMVTVLVLLFWLMLHEVRPQWLVLGSIAMGLSGGFRLPSMVFLAPLYLFSLCKYSRRQILLALLVASCSVLAWLVPTAHQIGGLKQYVQAVFELSSLSRSADLRTFSLAGLLFGQDWVVQSIGRLGMYVIYGLLGGLLPLGYLLLTRGPVWLKSVRRLVRDEKAQVLTIWLLPVLLGWAPRVKASGHTLSFIPGLLLLAGRGLVALRQDLAKRSWRVIGAANFLAGLVLLASIGFFLWAPPFLFGIRRVTFTTPSRLTIVYRDRYLSQRVEYITENFAPYDTAVWVTGLDYRHPDFYLRDYTSLQYLEGVSPWAELPEEIERLVVFSQGLNPVAAMCAEAETAVLPNGELIYTLPAPQDDRSSALCTAPQRAGTS